MLASVARRDRVEPGLEPGDGLAGELVGEGVDPRLRSDTVDAADAVQPAEHETPVPHGELVAVERTRRRPRGSVPFCVELAAVTRTAEASRLGRHEAHFAGGGAHELALVGEKRPVRLRGAADVRAAARHDCEARVVPELTVVADEDRPARDLARFRVGQERGDDELPFWERLDRPEVGGRLPLTEKRGQDRERGRRQSYGRADDAADPQRRGFEQTVAWKPVGVVGGRLNRLRLDRPTRSEGASSPEQSADDGDGAADRRDYLCVDDQADDQDEQPAREAHRQEPSEPRGHAASSTGRSRTAATPSASSTTLPTRIPPASSARFQIRP